MTGERGSEETRAKELEAGYSAGHRRYEIGGILLTTTLGSWFLLRLFKSQPLSGWWMPLAALVGILAADWVSGFFHWMFDTWGNTDTPVVGKLAIRTFRHHHVDQKAITRHDFIETNGHNIALATVCATSGLLVVNPEEATLFDVFVGQSLASMMFFVSFTSQIHKWAHQDSPPRVIQLLQRARLVLAPEHHAFHHAAPYQRNYCITVGWMNGPLRMIRFFETLEWIITAVTGAIPREDDLGKDTAIEVARELGELPEETPEPARAVVRRK
jgi:ubiquitin-conjugating enzyme E2 variant